MTSSAFNLAEKSFLIRVVNLLISYFDNNFILSIIIIDSYVLQVKYYAINHY